MDSNTTWRDRDGVDTKSGVYYKGGRGVQLPDFIFRYRNRTIMLLVDLNARTVYAGVGYINHAVLAHEVGIPIGVEFDKLVRPAYKNDVLSFNRMQIGVPMDADVWPKDDDEFRDLAFKNVVYASKLLVRAGMSESTRTVCEWVVLPLGVFAE